MKDERFSKCSVCLKHRKNQKRRKEAVDEKV